MKYSKKIKNLKNSYLILSSDKSCIENLLVKYSNDFKVLYREEVNWSEQYQQNNIERLFYNDFSFQLKLNTITKIYSAVVVRINNGFVYDLNENLFLDPEARKLNRTNEEIYFTSTPDDFLIKASLLYGINKLIDVLNHNNNNNYIKSYGDLVGFDGWSSFEELFEFLNLTTKWVVFRNAEFLPNDFWGNDKDVDCLCEDISSYKALSNANKRSNGVSSYCVKIENRIVDFDIRFLGDGYYDYFWEKSMLDTIEYKDSIVPVLSPVNYFYSLIYHGYLHKKICIKQIYLERLKELSINSFHSFKVEKYDDESYLLLLLQNFLKTNKYIISTPIDRSVWVNLNEKLIKKINLKGAKVTIKKKVILLLFKYRISKVKYILPSFISVRVLTFLKKHI